ncbi:hypothetical protein ATM17_22755 [Sphingopyxis macrogoltabida]|uniref:Uncharacterized protein n=1 Tax=Sphingopyxis macrogoltabida TaxID=33050 RepID=A0AAC9AXM1_SPHMC|nr:hypothetical protein LH19_22205 [Sphingopyxis macrogoltabida]AMU91836.1 hypothetical protein ATM17_22755 [Sphingopyxis macrogoltabida]
MLLLPCVPVGPAALFHLLLVASLRAASISAAVCAAFVVEAASCSLVVATLAADTAMVGGACSCQLARAGRARHALVFGPAALAGYLVRRSRRRRPGSMSIGPERARR